MAKVSLYKASAGGISNNGWMYTKHTFCFADYYDVDRIHFGALRVINDITIAPGKGLTDHPHTDMELVLLGMRGELVHRDSLGNETVLHEGSVQAISAGTYYTHAETNKSLEESVRILQFWIFPRARGLQSRYSHRQYAFPQGADWLLPLISPDEADGTIAIQQDAWLYLLGMSEGNGMAYALRNPDHGVYLHVLQGEIETEGQRLETEDGIGIWDTTAIHLKAVRTAQVILVEVPMNV